MSQSVITFVQLINIKKTLTETSYQFKKLRSKHMMTVSGEQSNEAPVWALLNTLPTEAKENASQSIRIVCLVSKEVQETITFERQSSSEHEEKCEKLTDSSYNYFCRKIQTRWQGQAPLEFLPVEYSEAEAEKCIPALLRLFKPGDEVFIDITSGMRTLPIHVTLCMEAMIHQHIEIKDVVYAYLNHSDPNQNMIRHEKHIDRMINLITAVHDFLDHGKADQLIACLNGAKNPLPILSRQMKTFSDKLILCRNEGIIDDVDEIHNTMATIIRAYESNPKSFENSPTQVHTFLSLLPTIKENFVDNCSYIDAEPAVYLKKLSLIQWCAQRNLLQLALSLYRENAAGILFGLHLIEIDKESPLCGNYIVRKGINVIDSYKSFEQTVLDRMHRIVPTHKEIDKRINYLSSKKGQGEQKSLLKSISDMIHLESEIPPKSIGDLIQLETELIQLWNTEKDEIIHKNIDLILWQRAHGKNIYKSLFEIGSNAPPSQALRPDEESIDIIEETGIIINMSQNNLQDADSHRNGPAGP